MFFCQQRYNENSSRPETGKRRTQADPRSRIPRNDNSLALAPPRPLPGLPLPDDLGDSQPHAVPVIKKKSSFGPFKFKNFFQSSKGKDPSGNNGIRKYKEPLAVLGPSNRVNQPTQVYAGNQSYDRRTTFHSQQAHHHMSRPIPRPPPICTTFPPVNDFASPYAPTSIYNSSPNNALPYMAGAGDGWDTPFLPYPPARAPVSHRTEYNNTEFPFPVVPSQHPEEESMEQLVVPDDHYAGCGTRVTSAAFEYQEFETDVRHSAQLDRSVSSRQSTERYTAADDLEAHALSARNPPSDNHGGKYTRTSHDSSKRESHVLPLSPALELERSRHRTETYRIPVVETVKPLSIGRNYPRSRSTAISEVYPSAAAGTIRSTQPLPWDTPRYGYYADSPVEERSKENRLARSASRQFSDLALDDTDSRVYDSPRW